MAIVETETSSDLLYFVANCLMGGVGNTVTPEGWVRDLVVFECAGRTFRFRQKTEVITGDLALLLGKAIETTEVIVPGVCGPDLEAVKCAVERICWLLSFVGTCRVIPFGYEYPNGSGRQNLISISDLPQHFRPVFEIRDGAQVKNFVDQVYDSYVALEGSRNLKVVFDYLAQTEAPGQLLEVRAILSFVALENLKQTFAKKEGIPFANGQFRKPILAGEKFGKAWTFKELLEKMFADVGITRDLRAAIALRNDLIHSGLSSETIDHQMALYEGVHDLIREYLLRLLGYTGRYCPYDHSQRGRSVELRLPTFKESGS